MNAQLLDLIHRFASLNTLVIGDAKRDGYHGRTDPAPIARGACAGRLDHRAQQRARFHPLMGY
jgi:hypothetical protein